MYIRMVYTYVEKGGLIMEASTTISKWGNSKGVRVPAEILKKAQVDLNDMLYFDVDEAGRIIMSKVPMPKEGTLEYLFKDYSGDSFETELIDLGDPVGNEQW